MERNLKKELNSMESNFLGSLKTATEITTMSVEKKITSIGSTLGSMQKKIETKQKDIDSKISSMQEEIDSKMSSIDLKISSLEEKIQKVLEVIMK